MNPATEMTQTPAAALANADFQFDMVDFGPSYEASKNVAACVCVCVCICVCACIIV